MTKEIYLEVKKLLSESNPNKAAIARKTGISVVQVRKVAEGGFDSKFDNSSIKSGIETPVSSAEKTEAKPSIQNNEIESSNNPNEEDLLPPPPKFTPAPFEDIEDHSSDSKQDDIAKLAPPSFGEISDDSFPPPASDLPPPAPVAEETGENDATDLPPPPSFGEVSDDSIPPPAPDLPPPAPLAEGTEENDATDLPPPPSFGEVSFVF
jgi:hypothetical protein